MSNERHIHVPRGARTVFAPWTRPLLSAWQDELSEYQAMVSPEDQPNWHGERTDFGFFGQAIRRCLPKRGFVLQEFPCVKTAERQHPGPARRKKKNGRADLWFRVSGAQRREFYVEAKHEELDLRRQISAQYLERLIAAARGAAKEVFDAKARGRWAATFVELWGATEVIKRASWPDDIWAACREVLAGRNDRAAALWVAEDAIDYDYKGKPHRSPGMLLIVEDCSE